MTIEQIRDAYETACTRLDRFGSLDAGIKSEMVDVLDCNPSDLEIVLGPMSSEEIDESIMS